MDNGMDNGMNTARMKQEMADLRVKIYNKVGTAIRGNASPRDVARFTELSQALVAVGELQRENQKSIEPTPSDEPQQEPIPKPEPQPEPISAAKAADPNLAWDTRRKQFA